MTDLTNKAKAFYALALSDPQKACQEHLASNFVLENPLPDFIPFGGTYHGTDGFIKYLTEIAASIEMGPLDMDDWVANDSEVVVRGSEASLVRATGRKYQMRFVHWLSFNEEGRIISMREYNDTAEMAKAFDR